MTKIGITERGDAGLDFSWKNKLLPDGNILITKSLNDAFIQEVVNLKNIIIHITCTGYGQTWIEPLVNCAEWTCDQTMKLIDAGFPADRLVLRTDPIIPDSTGLAIVKDVWDMFLDTGIKRVRYSYMDMYPHVIARYAKSNHPLPYSTFKAPEYMISRAEKMIADYGRYEFEACAESTGREIGCISKKDFDILGIEYKETLGYQRPGCSCIAGKTELLGNKTRCPHTCVYCYWKDKENK